MLASLRLHGSERAWVVHGNGLDELTTTGTSTVLALDGDLWVIGGGGVYRALRGLERRQQVWSPSRSQ